MFASQKIRRQLGETPITRHVVRGVESRLERGSRIPPCSERACSGSADCDRARARPALLSAQEKARRQQIELMEAAGTLAKCGRNELGVYVHRGGCDVCQQRGPPEEAAPVP